MSYIAYLNGFRIDLSNIKPIAQTKQVNDIARLSNRQSNFTHTFKLPLTPNNVKVLDKLYIIGNQSNIPYQKNEFDLIDADTGVHLIYKGWANIKKASAKEYDCYVYDGLIDFYKEIENKTLTNIGMSGLNHLKNLQNVLDSFSNTLPYMYVLADFNGDNFCRTNNLNDFNIDYQVPSARISFIWDRIFDFAGYTYEGSVFSDEKFLNLFMTFPKPVPTSVPVVNLVQTQTSELFTNITQVPTSNGGIEYVYSTRPILFPLNFDNSYANNNTGTILIETAGTYRISATGYFTDGFTIYQTISYTVHNSFGVLTQSGYIDTSVESKILSLNVGDKLFVNLFSFASVTGSMNTTIDYILGYEANFEDVLIDFKATDFVNEIIQRFGLTMFKDKYRKHVKFKTLKEIIANNNVIDWSNKFSKKLSESYIYGSYAQKNKFVYKYNEQNESHNDGFIVVNNKNLKDETTVVRSQIYTHEKKQREFIGAESGNILGDKSNVYKIWNKEIKEDGKIDYKELTGRYYFLRSKETITSPLDLSSDILNTSSSITMFQRESYDRLKFQEIIFDNYASLEAVLDKSKIIDSEFYLTPKDVADFNFENPIYIDKLGSYFLVNKISNFIKGKLTKVELIEIDYLKELLEIPPFSYYLNITNTILNNNCTITFEVETNIPQPINCNVIARQNQIAMEVPPEFVINGALNSNTITVSINSLPNSGIVTPFDLSKYYFRLQAVNLDPYINVITLPTNEISLTQSCYIPVLTYITITSVQTYQIMDNTRKVRVNFNTDLPLPSEINSSVIQGFLGFPINTTHNVFENHILLELEHITNGTLNSYSISLNKENIVSNSLISNQ